MHIHKKHWRNLKMVAQSIQNVSVDKHGGNFSRANTKACSDFQAYHLSKGVRNQVF